MLDKTRLSTVLLTTTLLLLCRESSSSWWNSTQLRRAKKLAVQQRAYAVRRFCICPYFSKAPAHCIPLSLHTQSQTNTLEQAVWTPESNLDAPAQPNVTAF